jgi:hypothetical protein
MCTQGALDSILCNNRIRRYRCGNIVHPRGFFAVFERQSQFTCQNVVTKDGTIAPHRRDLKRPVRGGQNKLIHTGRLKGLDGASYRTPRNDLEFNSLRRWIRIEISSRYFYSIMRPTLNWLRRVPTIQLITSGGSLRWLFTI